MIIEAYCSLKHGHLAQVIVEQTEKKLQGQQHNCMGTILLGYELAKAKLYLEENQVI